MIYVQLRARVKLAQGETLHVADAAKVLGSEKAGHCSLFCPTAPGVYTLDAIAVAKALKKVFPQEDISLIGAEVCYVHRIKARGKDFLRPVRTVAALLILLLGSALGLTWFHADVNMPQAQADVYAAITGAPPDDERRTSPQRDCTVSSSFSRLSAQRRNITPLGGSSSSFRKAFCAARFILSASGKI